MFFWTIAIVTMNVAYVGQFEDEAKCNKAAEAARLQSLRAICVQVKVPAPATNPEPTKK